MVKNMGEKNKMSWYKIAKDFDKRNVVNHKIIYLEDIKNILKRLSKLIFQSATMAKQSNSNIISSKKITSYPLLQEILIEADAIALDSPWRFASLCEEAVLSINNQIEMLKNERTKMMNIEKNITVEKGWI